MLMRVVVSLALIVPCSMPVVVAGAETVTLGSPDGSIVLTIESNDRGELGWRTTLAGTPVIDPSALGIVVDGGNLGHGAEIKSSSRYRVDEKYPWRGVHATAVNRANGARISVRHAATRIDYTIDARVSDDAVALRFIVEGKDRRVPDAGMTFQLPAESSVWTHGLRGHYEELYERRTMSAVPQGAWAGPPVTFTLPNAAGYASITEADLRDYAGMALQANGRHGFDEKLGHDHPPSYPYTLRFGDENAKRLAVAAPIEGTIRTPWRVVIIGRTLNALVNSDAVHNLCPPPDKALFPQGMNTPWLKPGRAVWRYLDGGENTLATIKEFSRLAGELGFEYQVVEGLWARWSEAELQDVIEYSRSRGVGLLVWRHRNTLGDPVARRALFEKLHKAGVAGLKVDFLDHEAKEVIDLYQAVLRDAAEFELMVNFHGANKPAGEPRTWPNEMTREGIYGMEHKGIKAWAEFNATFPFTRMLAGHADYTPVVFGERRRETSWAHQIASAAILTSPLLVYGGHPASLLANPAADIIKSLPSVWDETIVLPPSEIGGLALFARRSGDRWFVAAMNGPQAKTIKLDLSFLPAGTYRALIARDSADDAGAIKVETRNISRSQPLEIAMRPGGGFVLRATK
jgi:alpha-glucosidase